MHDHLEGLLTPFNMLLQQVVNGHGWVQVRLGSVNKENMVAKVLDELAGSLDFILCCRDDRTDEEKFKKLEDQQREKRK